MHEFNHSERSSAPFARHSHYSRSSAPNDLAPCRDFSEGPFRVLHTVTRGEHGELGVERLSGTYILRHCTPYTNITQTSQ